MRVKSKKSAGRKRKKNLRKRALYGFLGFFAVIMGLTILSKAADAFTVAKVTFTSCGSDFLQFVITGSGTIQSEDKEFQYGPEELRIQRILVSEGTKIEAGDVTVIVDMADLTEKIELVEDEIQKLEIRIEQNRLSGGNEIVSQTSGDILNRQYREEDMAAAQQQLIEAQEELEKAKKDYQKAQNQSQEELIASKKLAQKDAEASYDVAVIDYNNAVDKAKQLWQEAEAEYDNHPKLLFDNLLNQLNVQEDGTVAEDEAYEKFENTYLAEATDDEKLEAKAAVEDYGAGTLTAGEVYGIVCQEDNYDELTAEAEALASQIQEEKEKYQETKEAWDEKLKVEKDKVKLAKEAVKSAKEDDFDIEKAITAEKKAVTDAQDRIMQLNREIEKGNITTEQIQKTDSNALKAEANEARKRELEEKSFNIDLENKKQQLLKLKAVYEQEGQIQANTAGRIEALLVSAGERIGEDGLMSINTGSYLYQADLSDEDIGYLTLGDKIHIRFAGKRDTIESQIQSIAVIGSGKGRITAALPEGEYYSGVTASFEIIKRSDSYDSCVLLAALRQDMEGYYLLAAVPQNTVLGEQLVAERVPVTLIDKDKTKAAIVLESFGVDALILSANKQVDAGDRVRAAE